MIRISHPTTDPSRARHYSGNLHRVLAVAQEIARGQACPAVDAEHLALGLLELPECAACRMLTGLRVDLSTLRAELAEAATARAGDGVDCPDELPLAPRAQRALQIAYVEARTDHARRSVGFQRHGRVGTQHLLLGLVSPAGQVDLAALRRQGVFYSEVGEMVRRLEDPSDEQTRA